MLGSLSEADDAVQEAWLRLSRADASGVENLGGWLTTVVARVCLDMLRSRSSRGARSRWTPHVPEPVVSRRDAADPEQEALLADSVGARAARGARDAGARRAARVRAARHVRRAVRRDRADRRALARRRAAAREPRAPARAGTPPRRRRRPARASARWSTRSSPPRASGDFDALVAVLDPDVVLRADAAAVPPGAPRELRGAEAVAKGALAGSRRAGSLPLALALINGKVGVVVAPRGR